MKPSNEIGRINIKFGWSWLFVGILIAIWVGLFAFRSDWLGGYTSLPRRFLRLSHIAFMALSLTNILYGICIDSITLKRSVKIVGAYSMIVAAVFMPLVCIFSMNNDIFQTFFFIPALSFLIAVLIMAFGQLRRESE